MKRSKILAARVSLDLAKKIELLAQLRGTDRQTVITAFLEQGVDKAPELAEIGRLLNSNGNGAQ